MSTQQSMTKQGRRSVKKRAGTAAAPTPARRGNGKTKPAPTRAGSEKGKATKKASAAAKKTQGTGATRAAGGQQAERAVSMGATVPGPATMVFHTDEVYETDLFPPPPGKETTFGKRRRFRLKRLFENDELLELTLQLFRDGLTVKDMVAKLRRTFPGEDIRREDPHALVRKAASRWVIVPPRNSDYARQIADRYRSLAQVEVVATYLMRSVARAAAKALVHMLCSLTTRRDKNGTVHVGLAGGHTMRELVRALAEELSRPTRDLPKAIHIHALVTGFDANDPTTDPNTFFWYLNDPRVLVKVGYTTLPAPSMVSDEVITQLRQLKVIRAAYDALRDCGIIVTSGTHWHECSALRKGTSPPCQAILEAEGVVGDVLWRPISARGPIDVATGERAFTLVELSDLQRMVQQQVKVLLALGPCGICGEPKGELLHSILECASPFATHLVCDSRSALQLAGRLQ